MITKGNNAKTVPQLVNANQFFFDLKIFNREKNSFNNWPTFGLTRFPL